MYKLFLQKFCSLFLSTLFFLSPSCNSGGQTQLIAEDENRLPTRRELRRALRTKQSLTFIYPADKKDEDFYKVRIDALNKNERFDIKVKGIKITEVTKADLINDPIVIVGNVINNTTLKELINLLPFQVKNHSFIFDGEEYTDKEAIFKLFPYPNPYNQRLPLYVLTLSLIHI